MQNMNNLLFVALGGALGASMRYGVTLLMISLLGKGFPYATLLVNVIGSFFMGILFSVIEHGMMSDLPWRSLFGIGLLGAFTTFSTFSLDTLLLLQHGEWFKAVLNIFLNVVVCIFAAWLGMQLYMLKHS
jgi:CrcB protein